MKVEFRRAALAQLINQLDWLVARSPVAAERAADRIEAVIKQIADFPESTPLKSGGYREATVSFGRDGFIIRYRVIADTVYVIRVLHGRQNRPD